MYRSRYRYRYNTDTGTGQFGKIGTTSTGTGHLGTFGTISTRFHHIVTSSFGALMPPVLVAGHLRQLPHTPAPAAEVVDVDAEKKAVTVI